MSPRQVLSSHTSRDIAEWQALYRLEARERDQADLDATARAGVASRMRR